MSDNVRINLPIADRMAKNQDLARYKSANQAVIEMSRYVPYSGKSRSPNLRESVTLSGDGRQIRYSTPYAKSQFYGFVGKTGARVRNYTTPGTSRRWDLRLKNGGGAMQNVLDAYLRGLR
jgi:hypothetical protein